MTASEAVTLRIDRDELRAAGRRAHSAGKLSDEQLARIEALCEGDLPVGKPTVDLADDSIAAGLDLGELDVEWVNVPFPQGGLVSTAPPAMPVGEISAEWLSDSLVIEGERSAEWLSDSVVLEGEASAVFLGDSAVFDAERSAEWLNESQIVEGGESGVLLGDSAVIERIEIAAPAPARAALESYVPDEEWPAPPSDDAPSLPRAFVSAAPVGTYEDDSEVRAPWPSQDQSSEWAPVPSSDWAPAPHVDRRYAGDDGAADEDAYVTNQPEGWAHVGTSVVGRVESPWSDDKAITLPPVVGAVSPHALAAAVAKSRFGEPPQAFPIGPHFGGLGAPSPRAILAAPRVEPPSPMHVPVRHGTLLSAQPNAASVSGFAPLHAGTKLRKPLQASDASAVLAGQKGDADSTINAKYPWLGPVLFAAALILGLIGEWIISSPPAVPPVATAAPKAETAQVIQPSSIATPSITLVGAPANVR